MALGLNEKLFALRIAYLSLGLTILIHLASEAQLILLRTKKSATMLPTCSRSTSMPSN